MTPLSRLRLRFLLPALLLALTACSASPGSGSATPPSPPASSPSADPSQVQRYVALGDSYTAAPLVPVTDVANGCFRSSNNYPALVARALDTTVADVSCGGATTRAFTRAQHADVPPQLDAVKPDTQLVTVGIGGNDGGVFGTLTYQCPTLRSRDPQGAPCEAAMRQGRQDRLLRALRQTQASVTRVLRQVKQRAPQARVLVVGYPQLVDASHRCTKLPLATGDYAYGERVNKALTQAVKAAAEATRSEYVDVWAASQGHDICSSDPWINGAVNDQQRAARYHPFAVEQQAVAALVEKALEG